MYRYLFLLSILVGWIHLQAQVQLNNGISYKVESKGDQPIHYFIQDASVIKGTASADTSLRMIVKFKSEPFTKSSSKGLRSTVDQDHKNFENDLLKIERSLSQRSATSSTTIHHHFKSAFNGKSITASKSVIDQVRKLPYVEYVVEDKMVHVSDNTSNTLIQADKVWNQYSITGQGIVIGIIDTGIDYTHPDIGGGMGNGFKVMGGYDFVNGDSDPMDDHGHGTHVAGIAAANGSTLKGVAPDARLMAFKVLDKNGSGYDSWILAGIERSIDPDQNPATNDHVNVVNMSLGRLADGPDPLSEAVENAVSAGIVFAIAAGNDGAYQTIASPGIAPSAITVGATDASDALANFSSKGPARGTYTLKPDLVAPGVGIYSLAPGGKYATMNGTSMASPHVAGAAALILQMHPSWTPLQVKSALMENTKSLLASPYDVGTGRLDVFQAIRSTFSVSPASVSLSMVDLGTPVVSTSFQLTVVNYSGSQKTYSLSQSGDLGSPALTTTIDQPTLTLNPGASQVVTVNISITTANLVIKNLPDLYLGYINITDNVNSVKVPVGLPNPQHLKLHFAAPLPQSVFISGVDNYIFNVYSVSGPDLDVVITQGKFDIISIYGYSYVIKENVSVPQTTDISISKTEAVNQLVFQPVDENGKRIVLNPSMLGVASISTINQGGSGFISFMGGAIDTLWISSLSNRWRWNFRINDFNPGSNKIYNVGTSEAGVTQSKIVTNRAEDLVPVQYDFDRQHNSTVSIRNVVGVQFGGLIVSTFNNYGRSISSDFTEYFQKINKNSIDVISNHVIVATAASGYGFETQKFSLYTNDSIAYRKGTFGDLTESSTLNGTSLKIKPDDTMLQWGSAMVNDLNLVLINPAYQNGHFRSNRGDKVLDKVTYTLSNSSGIVKSGYTLNPTTLSILGESTLQLKGIDAGPYTFQMDYNAHQVQGKFGKATTTMIFNTSLSDKNPPYLTRFELRVNNHLVNQFNQGDVATISLSVTDDCYAFNYPCIGTNSGMASYSLSYKKEGDANWTPLTLSNDVVQLPSDLKDGFYSLKVNGTDNAGNSLTYSLEPAFLIGTNPNPVPFRKPFLEYPQAASAFVPQNTIFKWSTLTGAVDYLFLIASDSTFTTNLQTLHFANDSIRLSTLLNSQSTYFWKVQAIYPNGVSPWSDVSSFTTGTGTTGVVNLIAPQANASNLGGTITMTWSSVPNAIGYQLTTTWQIPSYPFPLTSSSATSETSAVFYASPSTSYSWYVTPLYTNIQGEPSEIRQFTTGQPLIIAQNPVNQTNNVSILPFLAWDENFTSGVYHVTLSSNQDLSNPIVNADTYSKSYMVNGLQPSTNYYWKVGSYYSNTPYWSDLFTFRTTDVLGVEEANAFYVYPNPASSVVNFRFESTSHQLNIINSLGQSIWNQEGSESSLSWNVSSIESGLYIALITDGDKTIRQKFIVKR
jgi:subtilisin family serine protease